VGGGEGEGFCVWGMLGWGLAGLLIIWVLILSWVLRGRRVVMLAEELGFECLDENFAGCDVSSRASSSVSGFVHWGCGVVVIDLAIEDSRSNSSATSSRSSSVRSSSKSDDTGDGACCTACVSSPEKSRSWVDSWARRSLVSSWNM